MVKVGGFEPPISRTQTVRVGQATLYPDIWQGIQESNLIAVSFGDEPRNMRFPIWAEFFTETRR